jgi:hypothetical protein
MSEYAQFKAQLDRIERALTGDERMGQPGLVARMADAEGEIHSLKQDRRDEKNQKRGAVWVFTTVGAIAGVVGGIVSNFWGGK